jgi:hypothetical protein
MRHGESMFRVAMQAPKAWRAVQGIFLASGERRAETCAVHEFRDTRPAAINPPCPCLPDVREIHDFTLTRRHGTDRGPAFYRDALCFAQSQWMSGKPAQAILQLDKAWMADIPAGHPVLAEAPPPYQALAWILAHARSGHNGYLGNPVRHFQHLASRMSGARAEVRVWRAWLCFHLAERALPRPGFPRDGRQLVREGLWIPAAERGLVAVAAHGWPGEAELAARWLRL